MSRKRVVVAGVSSLIVIAGVTVATLLFGIIAVPAFQTFAAAPLDGATGRIAFVQAEDSESDPCLFVLDLPGTQPREIVCSAVLSFAWLEDGRLAVSDDDSYGYEGEESTVTAKIYSADTGDEVDETPVKSSSTSYETATSRDSLKTDYDGARVRNGNDDVIADFGGPRDYMIGSAQYSPDRNFMVLTDSEGRTLVSTVDGQNVRVIMEANSDDQNDDYYVGSHAFGGASTGWYQQGKSENTVTAEALAKEGFVGATADFTSQPFFDDF